MRVLRRVSFVLVAAIVVVLGHSFLWGDAEPDDEIGALLDMPERLAPKSNLSNALFAMRVAPGADPAREGYDAVTRINDALRMSGDPQARRAAVEAAGIVPVVEFEDAGQTLCQAREPGCLARLAKTPEAVRDLARDNRVLLERYLALPGFAELRSELLPDYEAPLPDINTLASVHRLRVATILVDALVEPGGAGAAIEASTREVRFLTRALGQADLLIQKMIFAALLANSLHLHAALAELAAVPAVARLDEAGRSLETAMRGEFRIGASYFRTLPERPELTVDLGVPAWLAGPMLRPLYKPMRSVEQAYRCHRQTLRHVSGEPARLLAGAGDAAAVQCKPRLADWVLNPVGTTLVHIAAPDYRRYAARLHHLDALIVLVNLKRRIVADGVDADALGAFLAAAGADAADPFTGRPAVFDATAGLLTFDRDSVTDDYARLPLDAL